MALVVGTNSWVSLAEAEEYFTTRINSDPWDDLTDDASKEAFLVSAYNWIIYDPMFTVTATATETAVKNGQCEAALFMINYYEDYEKREAIIASGVTKFNYSEWHEFLGEVSKPSYIVNYFTSAGFYNGGVALTVLKDDNTLI